MKFGLYFPNFGNFFGFAENYTMLAELAEESGWDGLFIWDHILGSGRKSPPTVDPWVALTVMASNSTKIKVGTTVTPLPRRRPWKLARETVSIDHLSKGRLILSVGLGEPLAIEYGAFGEEKNPRILGEKLDESLDILQGLWSGEEFSYSGKHYQINNVQFLPESYQQPRIKIWVGGQWNYKKPFIRGAKYDGMFPLKKGFRGKFSDKEISDLYKFLESRRQTMENYDLVTLAGTSGNNTKEDYEKISYLSEKGFTWALEYLGGSFTSKKVMDKIKTGPPRK
ncbi:MAG: LLM class flavin-dependent oxidoreductase [Candidatus Kariarchaeaceae archaeon]